MEEVAPPRLALRNLSKSFGGTQALRGVDLSLLPGEVHGLLGENGSGKSTLIKILAGFHGPDEGELLIDGEAVRLPLAPGQFRELGLSFVHQDLGLIESLSVLENLRVAELASSRSRFGISWGRERRRARETFERYGLRLDPAVIVAGLKPVERALLAIVRAIEEIRSIGAGQGVLVLDEPTVFLPREGIEVLFSLVREAAGAGASVLFVSHDLDEVREITDRVTVLRDGALVGTVGTTETSETRFVELIIGRRLAKLGDVEHADLTERRVGVAVEGVSGSIVNDVSFQMHEGEIVGLTGLIGSGFEEVVYLLYGARSARGGRLVLRGQDIELARLTPNAATRSGIALIPADRKTDGSVGSLPVVENLALAVLDRYFNGFSLELRRMRRETRALMHEFDVRPNEPSLLYGALSGGNQQKALLAKWFQTEPKLLLLDEPTQGVDVGARQQIFGLIRTAVEERGMHALCASSDYEQLSLLCDRVIVFGRGRVWRELVGVDVTKERIIEQSYAAMAAEVAGVVA
ncbi:MAG: sugar ABC transporter ATP-binding protein [Gaiellaceae bacterium MAG52_C11]|nr:sugar ABC transporter ATP-binding protein [Candidatus Gaiellasilicea maunaloa]